MMLSLEPRTLLLLAQPLLVLLILQDLLRISAACDCQRFNAVLCDSQKLRTSDPNKDEEMTTEEPMVTVQEAGPHTLHYFISLHLVRSGETQFMAHGYIDGDLFLRYKGDRRRAEALRARIKGHAGAETWARETEGLWKMEKQLRRILAEVTGQDRGLHTIQVTLGCELQRNGNIGGFWHLGYDGQDALTFDQKTLTWTMAVPSTQQTKTFWETHAPRTDQVKTFLKGTCPSQLQRHLNSLRNSQMDTGPPKVNVTKRRYPVGRITLTCWAFNLYPPVATLTWLRDGKPVQQHTFGPRTILPSGDGTYQTRMSIWVLPGQEPHFTCRLKHCRSNIEAPTVLSEKIGQWSTLGRGMQGWETSVEYNNYNFLGDLQAIKPGKSTAPPPLLLLWRLLLFVPCWYY